MKRKLATFYFVFGVFIIGLGLFANCDNQYSKKVNRGKDNLTHSKGLKIGMSEPEVLKIMGKPDTIIKDSVYYYYNYILNDDSYSNGQISFDSTKRVNEIFFPKN
jgi:hypothetical protein